MMSYFGVIRSLLCTHVGVHRSFSVLNCLNRPSNFFTHRPTHELITTILYSLHGVSLFSQLTTVFRPSFFPIIVLHDAAITLMLQKDNSNFQKWEICRIFHILLLIPPGQISHSNMCFASGQACRTYIEIIKVKLGDNLWLCMPCGPGGHTHRRSFHLCFFQILLSLHVYTLEYWIACAFQETTSIYW